MPIPSSRAFVVKASRTDPIRRPSFPAQSLMTPPSVIGKVITDVRT